MLSRGGWSHVEHELAPFDSMLSEFADPERAPELLALRDKIRSWRFYDQFRTDSRAQARGVRGDSYADPRRRRRDVAAAVQTSVEIGDAQGSKPRSTARFPAARSPSDHFGRFELEFHQHGLLRPLGGGELSGETGIKDQSLLGRPTWHWPHR